MLPSCGMVAFLELQVKLKEAEATLEARQEQGAILKEEVSEEEIARSCFHMDGYSCYQDDAG